MRGQQGTRTTGILNFLFNCRGHIAGNKSLRQAILMLSNLTLGSLGWAGSWGESKVMEDQMRPRKLLQFCGGYFHSSE